MIRARETIVIIYNPFPLILKTFFAAAGPHTLLCREDNVSTPTSSSRTVSPPFRPFQCREDNVSTPTSSSRTVSPPFRPFQCREDNVSTPTSSSRTVSPPFRPFQCREDNVSTPTSSSRRPSPTTLVRVTNRFCLHYQNPMLACSFGPCGRRAEPGETQITWSGIRRKGNYRYL